MVKEKNRTKKRQYIPKSHSKYGIKHWVLCESSTGYTINFNIYAGKQDSEAFSTMGQSYDVVFRLLNQSNLQDNGHHVICDNFYTSIPLADDLYKRRTILLVP